MNIEFIEDYYRNFAVTPLRRYYSNFPFTDSSKYSDNALSLNDIDIFYSEIEKVVDMDRKILAAGNPNFNIWRAVGLERSELKYCSILRWLLNPKDSHFQGDGFLQLFINAIPKIATKINFAELDKARVRNEVWINNATRADILVTTKTFQIAIEAKIDATEQYEQLQRYSAIPSDNLFIIFLTIDGRSASTDKENICINMSWRDIAEICQEFSNSDKSCKNPFIAEIVQQYSEMLKYL